MPQGIHGAARVWFLAGALAVLLLLTAALLSLPVPAAASFDYQGLMAVFPLFRLVLHDMFWHAPCVTHALAAWSSLASRSFSPYLASGWRLLGPSFGFLRHALWR